MFGQILVEFLFRLTFGVACAMGLTPSKQVTSGFFRVHLWVLLGVQTLAALAVYSSRPDDTAAAVFWTLPIWKWQLGLATGAAVASYIGAVLWMYERNLPGKFAIWLVAGLAILGCTLPVVLMPARPVFLQIADRVSGGLVLGLVTTAMLLGHWYLNTPTMKLEPLRRLILLLAGAVVLRMIICGTGFGLDIAIERASPRGIESSWLVFVALRWLAGLFGVLGLAWLTWKTLEIPNTQSATGILYAGVILAFIGELTSQLLSAEARFPL